MPVSDWIIEDSIRVIDRRKGQYLLVNQETGLWSVTNRAGVTALTAHTRGGRGQIPESLALLRRRDGGPRPADHVPTFHRTECLFVIYKLTDSCNYRCAYCYDRKVARPKIGERRDAAIRELLDLTLKQQGKRINLLFHGGEPLLEFAAIKSLIEAYKDYHPHQLQFSIQTNLSHLNQEMLDIFKKFNVGISVSVDGVESGSNRLRMLGGRENPFLLVKRKIQELSGLEANRVGLMITLGSHNVAGLSHMLSTLQAEGFRSVSFSFMQEVNRRAESAGAQELAAALREVVERIISYELDDLALWTIIQWVWRLMYGRSEMVCMESPCGAGRSVITVLPSGEIGPCDSIFDPAYYAGNLGEYISALEPGGSLTGLLNRSVDNIEVCKLCDVKAHCNGTCPGSVILENGELTGVAAQECAFHYAWIKELLWLLSDRENALKLLDYCSRHLQLRERRQNVLSAL